MADTTKEKIIKISTQGAEKNVKSLKQQIKELRDELGTLEKGTAEYDRVAKQLADTNQRQIEVGEAMKYANKDIGATLSNLTSITAGVIGAIQGVNVVMQAFGASEEDAAKATHTLQQSMALIQSLAALDTAQKAVHGLAVAFGEVDAAATAANAATAKQGGIVKDLGAIWTKLAKTMKMSRLALAGWTAAVTVAVVAVVKLVKHHKELQENQRKSYAESIRWQSEASQSVAEMVGKYDMLRESYITAKNSGENMTAWVKEHNSALNELNITTANQNSLDDIFIKKTKEYVDALTQRYTAEWKLKAAQDEYIANLKEINAFRDNFDPNKWTSLNQKIRLTLGGEEVTKTYQEWRQAADAAEKRNEDIMKQMGALTKDMLTANSQIKALNGNTNNIVTGTVKTLKQLIAEFRELYKSLLNESLNWRNFKSVFDGMYDEAERELDRIKTLIKANDLDKVLNEKFKQGLEIENGELRDNTRFDVNLGFVFDRKKLKETEDQLIEAEAKLARYSNGVEKMTQKALDEQEKTVKNLKTQIAAYNELGEAVLRYLTLVDKEKEKYGETATRKRSEALEREKEIYDEYWTDVLANNPWADTNRQLNETEASLERVKAELQEIDQEEKDMAAQRNYNKEAVERYREIAARREELEKQQTELERSLEQQTHDIRMQHLEEEYAREKDLTEKTIQDLKNQRNALGGGVMDYSTDVDALNLQLQAIKNQYAEVERYYGNLMSALEEASDEWIQLEIEKQAALTTLEEDGAKKRAEITQAEVERKTKIQQTYMNFLGSVTGQIQNLLNEKMNSYDQDSQAYKRLQISQATITTLEGALSAFMSGFQSGIPFPGNLAAAVALSGLVFQTGLQQIENIKKESLNNSATSTPTSGNFGEYDTLSYAQNSDILATLEDSRVYVTEHDITSTQRRVAVRESESTF